MKRRGTYKTFIRFCNAHQKTVYVYRCPDETTGGTRTLRLEFSRDVDESTGEGELQYDARTGTVREMRAPEWATHFSMEPDSEAEADELRITRIQLPDATSSASATSSSISTSSASASNLEPQQQPATPVRTSALGEHSHTLPKSLFERAPGLKSREQAGGIRALPTSTSPSGPVSSKNKSNSVITGLVFSINDIQFSD